MKISRTEFGHEYGTYQFGYCQYAELEKGDSVANFYAQGFLPYSANPKLQGLFYMARSARVALPDFARTSENRRIGRFFDGMFTRRTIAAEEARSDARVRDLFLTYFASRHGTEIMPEARLVGILSSPLPLQVHCYEKEGALIAAAIEVSDGTFGHFWFSAYDLSYIHQSLGMWLMLDSTEHAKTAHYSHYYLGTVYGEKALYKTNIQPMQFWDGSTWDRNIEKLKSLARLEPKDK
ncbi:MAG: arginine-tRNA-protein transferase domain protein [Parcubacteria group bacterium]|nr:arginine-tRNA-protein transferase domain protein [Parcubacteria group bacterium]